MMEELSELVVLVEGDTDAAIVKNILQVAFPLCNPSFIVCYGKHRMAKIIKKLPKDNRFNYIALIDSDEPSIVDSREEASRQLGNPKIPVFCAVPTIEAWLFADEEIAKSLAKDASALRTIQRMPLPESIPYPKYLVGQLLRISKSPRSYEALKKINIQRALARSPSMRSFIEGVSNTLGVKLNLPEYSMASTVSRDVFSTLLRELPGDTIAWRTLAGESYSAAELADNIGQGTEVGKQYVTELLRVARDLTLRKAKK
ncbi:DUF4276 family protein [Pseudomonas sp. zbq_4]|uniref:DUF4276 family protein n=1 Tax=Pseudomonas sp. zbq_4 TaxID=3367240 RepID=UPI00370BB2B8